jgi:serine/threonine-protein kinase
MGTPSYMAPEQAAGQTGAISPRTDVYSLGAILYECLTGRPPFHAATPVETVMQVLDRVPAPPRVLNSAVPRDLETVCLTCLHKEPGRRYASALELAEDLRRFRGGEKLAVGRSNVLSLLVGALEKASHTEAEFRTWGTMLVLFGAIILAGHVTTTVLMFTGQPPWTDWVSRAVQLALGLVVFWRYHGRSLLPGSPAERLLWAIWAGYLAAYGASAVVNRLLIARGLIDRPEGASVWRDELTLYPYSAILSGLAFIIMGSSLWGRYYVLGASFLGMALLMPLALEWAPLAFGLLWAASLAGIGLHLRRIARGAGGGGGAVVTGGPP